MKEKLEDRIEKATKQVFGEMENYVNKISGEQTARIFEVEEKMDQQIEEIGRNQKRLNSVENRCEENATSLIRMEEEIRKEVDHQITTCKRQLNSTMRTTAPGREVPVWRGGSVQEMELPRFSKRKFNPMEFLQVVERKFKRGLEEGWLEWEIVENSILKALEGECRSWYQVYSLEIHDLTSFKEKFVQKYWNERIQSRERERIMYGRYNGEEGVTRTEYFLAHVLIWKNLDGNSSEEEIVRLMLNHFSNRVREAAWMQKVNSVKGMELLLESFELLREGRVYGEGNQRVEGERYVESQNRNVNSRFNLNYNSSRGNQAESGNSRGNVTRNWRERGVNNNNYPTRNQDNQGNNRANNNNQDNNHESTRNNGHLND